MILLQTATVFGLNGGNISLSLSMNMGLVISGRQTERHTAGTLVLQPSAFGVEVATKKVKKTQITEHCSNPSGTD